MKVRHGGGCPSHTRTDFALDLRFFDGEHNDVLIEAELDFLARGVVVGGDGLQQVAAELALDGGRALLARAGPLALGLAVLGAAAPDLGLHLRDLDGQLAVQRVAARLHRHVAQADAYLRVLRNKRKVNSENGEDLWGQ